MRTLGVKLAFVLVGLATRTAVARRRERSPRRLSDAELGDGRAGARRPLTETEMLPVGVVWVLS